MSYLRKIGDRIYAYMSKREGKKVHSIYLGTESGVEAASKIRDTRSTHAKAVDASKDAETSLPATPKNIEKWRADKSGVDLRGIDTKQLRVNFKELLSKLRSVSGERRKVEAKVKEIEVKFKERKKPEKLDNLKLTGVERENLYKLADKYQLSRDLVDWQSLIDPSLTFQENKTELEDYLSQRGKQKELSASESEVKSELQRYVSELKDRLEQAQTPEEKQEIKAEIEGYEKEIKEYKG